MRNSYFQDPLDPSHLRFAQILGRRLGIEF